MQGRVLCPPSRGRPQGSPLQMVSTPQNLEHPKAQRPYELRDLQGKPITAAESRELCLQYRVPDEVRQRNNKRFRRNKAEQKTEARQARRQNRGK